VNIIIGLNSRVIFLTGIGYAMFTGFFIIGVLGIIIQYCLTGKNYTHDSTEPNKRLAYALLVQEEGVNPNNRPLFINNSQ